MAFSTTKVYLKIIAALLIGNATSFQVQAIPTLGVDFSGSSTGFTTVSNDSWTLGYAFSVSDTSEVTGLGFWDLTGDFNSSTVGLWTTGGSLLGTVNTSNTTVDTFATGNGVGTWNFMDFNYTLSAGNYVVGAWGDGMEYAYDYSASSITTNELTFIESRYESGGIFQFPSYTDYCGSCYFGANISFASSSVPEPTALGLLGLGLAGIGFSRKRKAH